MDAAVPGQVSQFRCPHCSAVLRIRGRVSVGREFDCPDCHRPILIVSDGMKQLTAQKVIDRSASRFASSAEQKQPSEQKPRPAGRKTTREATAGEESSPFANGRFSAIVAALKSPVGVAWSAASLMTLIVAIAVWPAGSSKDNQTNREQTGDAPSSVQQDGQLPNVDRPNGTQLPATAGPLDHQPPEIPAPETPAESEDHRTRTPVDATEDAAEDATNDAIVKTPVPHSVRREPVIAPKPQPFPKPKSIDVAGRLRQPILRFDQSQSVPAKELLSLVEEMAAVPIRFDQPVDEETQRRLDRRISLTLTQTTVGGILMAVLDRVGLTYRTEADGIRIGKRKPKSKDHEVK